MITRTLVLAVIMLSIHGAARAQQWLTGNPVGSHPKVKISGERSASNRALPLYIEARPASRRPKGMSKRPCSKLDLADAFGQ